MSAAYCVKCQHDVDTNVTEISHRYDDGTVLCNGHDVTGSVDLVGEPLSDYATLDDLLTFLCRSRGYVSLSPRECSLLVSEITTLRTMVAISGTPIAYVPTHTTAGGAL